jgi:tetratricopeptide (TPR) repeat protein
LKGLGVPDLLEKWRHRRIVLALSTGLLISAFMICTWFQVRHWQDSIALFKHTLNVTDSNWLVHNSTGLFLIGQGSYDEAIRHLNEALRIFPEYEDAHLNLGVAKEKQGLWKEAITHYSDAIRINPDYAKAHNNLGNVYTRQGRFKAAIDHYSEALRINPDYAMHTVTWEMLWHTLGGLRMPLGIIPRLCESTPFPRGPISIWEFSRHIKEILTKQ